MALAIPEHIGDWTVDDYLSLPESATKVELSEGHLVVSPSPSRTHQQAMYRLMRIIEDLTGRAVHPDVDTVLSPLTVRRPDIAVTGTDALDREGPLSADEVLIAIEIVSLTSRTTDRIVKPAEYAAAGIGGYWRVELDPLLLTAHFLTGGTYTEIGTWGPGETARITAPITVEFAIDELIRRPA